ncbi:MAG: hypothetical protein IPK67_14320 [Planctomycetes bacterium]|nr:hypothetical protein [Planctomycetota bacterium]
MLYDTKRQKEALAVIGELQKVVRTQTLGRRYAQELEADLAAALSDPALGAAKRRAKVIEISGAAVPGTTPWSPTAPRWRRASPASRGKGVRQGHGGVPADRRRPRPPDAATLAGSLRGLGDCVFAKAIEMQKANKDANPTFLEAVKNYMRVGGPVPRAGALPLEEYVRFRSGPGFLGDDTSRDRAGLYRSVMRQYKESTWAEEARKQLGG